MILVMSAVNHAAFFCSPASWAVVVLSQNAVWQG